ncbi:TetR/AcrR family transcriptional regulator [Cupriavidus gilardii]|uniref:TetR/AcrR family transcriptional regulator n=1 Tax=Cupriavidus gilardii TaxID=82541 RepID=UPI001EE5B7BF|nr:TetR/AcrR family transcriptional regulator [Cupriavidus gilardii]MCG5261541.1 TetR/AcrR family transcriptional regulator [Cupriavidus gilardii]MDF9432762.1 TetR/AcrR family transcriptional regulator [Cupriavidus gilardii]
MPANRSRSSAAAAPDLSRPVQDLSPPVQEPAPRRPGRPGRPGRPDGSPPAGKLASGAAPRGPGRVLGPEDQRERLLDAAVSLFAEHGVAATQVKAIAARAGVTPALVHYYFGDRGRLLDAVAQERLGPLVDRVFAPMEGDDRDADSADSADAADPAALLAGIAERLIRAAVATPWFPALWVREIVTGEGQLRERVMQRFGLQRVGGVVTALSAARTRGQIDPALAPPLLMVSVIGLALLPLATGHIWRRLPGADAVDVDAMVAHARALLTHGIRAGDPGTSSHRRRPTERR